MPELVCVVPHEAGVIAGVGLHHRVGVDGLVCRLWIQNETGHCSGPGVRPPVLVPVSRQTFAQLGHCVLTFQNDDIIRSSLHLRVHLK